MPAPRAHTHGEYTVLAGDFHVHGFPDGILPGDAAREAARRRLDVIALTSHNSLRGWWMWTRLPSPAGTDALIVLPGEELTSAGYHLALVGITRTVPWRQSMRQAAAAAHAQGAVAILAHPASDPFRERVTDDDLRAVDGVEIAHPEQELSSSARENLTHVYRRAAALDSGVAAIGSSDFHYFGPIGFCRTYLFVRERTAAGVLDAIRAARTVACDGRGDVSGPPELAGIVAARCHEEALAPPIGDTQTSRTGTFLVWAGLATLVLLGPSRS
jgi:hypothetical protein